MKLISTIGAIAVIAIIAGSRGVPKCSQIAPPAKITVALVA